MTLSLDAAKIAILQFYVSTNYLEGYYAKLAEYGSAYAELALGVVRGDTASGQIANDYLYREALAQGITLNSGDLQEIKLQIMQEDFAIRQSIVAANGFAIGELSYEQQRDIHAAAFTEKNVPISAWTPFRAAQMFGTAAGAMMIGPGDIFTKIDTLTTYAIQNPGQMGSFSDYIWDVFSNISIEEIYQNIFIPLAGALKDAYVGGQLLLQDVINAIESINDSVAARGVDNVSFVRPGDTLDDLVERMGTATRWTFVDPVETASGWSYNSFVLEPGAGAAGTLTLADGTVISLGGSSDAKLTSMFTSSGTAQLALVNLLADLGVNTTFQQIKDMREEQFHPQDSAPVDPHPSYLNPRSRGDGTYYLSFSRYLIDGEVMRVEAPALVTVNINGVPTQVTTTNNELYLLNVEDISKDIISNIQYMHFNGNVAMTAAQFNSFNTVGGVGAITATTGGTYSLAGRQTGNLAMHLKAESWDGTTLIANNNANGAREILTASLFGNDTLVAGVVGSDLIGGLGINQITGGVGQDYIEFSGKIAAGSSISGGGAEDTLALRGGGDISGATISTVEKLEAVGTGGNTIALTAQQLAGFSTLVGAMTLQGVNTGTYSLAGKTYSTGQIDFIGSDGNDRIDYTGFKSVEGGGGFDTLVLGGSSSYTIDLASATNQVVGSSAAVTGFESIDASALTGTLAFTGNDTANEITGSAGAGSIYGYGGNDRITYDTLDTIIDGGSGSDTLVLAGSASRTVNLGNTADQVTGGGTTKGFENVDGSTATGSLTVTGDANANVLKGGSAADSINGGDGDDTITYSANDTLIDGGSGNDTLIAAAGTIVDLNNTVDQIAGDAGITRGFEFVSYIGGGGNSTINGDSGDNVLTGATGAQDVFGLGGNDTITYDAADGTVDGGSGTDTLLVNTGITANLANTGDQVTAGGTTINFENIDASGATAAVSLTGDANANVLKGGAGADTLVGAAGADSLYGDGGNDTLTYDVNDTTVDGGGGIDTLILAGTGVSTINLANADQVNGGGAASGFENVDGSGLNSGLSLTGDANANILKAGGAWDTLIGGSGADSLYGNGGNDTITHDAADVIADGGAGVDTLKISGSTAVTANLGNVADQVTGGGTSINFENIDASTASAAMSFTGDSSANILKGGTGADTIIGNGGADSLYGNGGNDTITYDAAATLIDGGTGDDTLIVAAGVVVDLNNATDQIAGDAGITIGFEHVTISGGSSTITGDEGDNTLPGAAGAQDIFGLGGNDTITYDAADGTVDGGAGTDTLLVTTGITANLATTADQVTAGGTTINFENIDASGASAAVNLTGDANANVLKGGSAADTLVGAGGVDSLFGNGGNDTLTYDANDTTIDGGSGVDTLILAGSVSSINLANADQVTGGGTASGFENIDGSALSTTLTLTGNSAANLLKGGSGADTIVGSGGADSLYGNGGDDTITYDAAAALIDGGTGDDTLIVAAGTAVDLNNTTDQIAGDAGITIGFEHVTISGGSSTITGDEGDNTLPGAAGAQDIYGLGGNDTITYDAADGTVDGGVGTDTLLVNTGVTANLANTADQVTGGGTTINFENIDGSSATAATNLTGDANANVLRGGSAGDTLVGAAGADSLFGNGGDDLVTYDVNDTAIDGGGGIDTLILAGTGVSTINLANADQVNGGGTASGFENVDGSGLSSGLSLTGDANANILKAGGAWDTLIGGAGADSLYGMNGNDTITYDAADVIHDGGTGVDTLKITGATAITVNLTNSADQVTGGGTTINFENIDASSASTAMNFTGGAEVNSLKGGSGADTIIGGGGADSLYGNGGDDTITYDAAAALIDGGTGTDTLIVAAGTVVDLNNTTDQIAGDAGITIGFENVSFSGGGTTTINGDAGDNTLAGTAAAEDIFGFGGNDTITYDAADGTVDGGTGFDTLVVTTGLTANLSTTTDQVTGGGTTINFENIDASDAAAAVSLTGDANANVLKGGTGADSLYGSGGNDTITYDVNDTTVDGGSGNDTLILAGSGVSSINLANADQVNGGGSASGFENVDGSGASSGLTLTGDANANILKAGGAWDVLEGGAGADSLYGLGGNDTITYDSLDLLADGGTGTDTLKIFGSTAITANLANAADQITGGGTTINFENVDGSFASASLDITGNANANILKGGSGNDIIDGAGGADSLYGNAGYDIIQYNSAASVIDGGAFDSDILRIQSNVALDIFLANADQVSGGGTATGFENIDAALSTANLHIEGDDNWNVLTGGTGNDVMGGGGGSDSLYGNTGSDTILYDAADTITDGGGGTDMLLLYSSASIDLANAADQSTGGSIVVGFENVDASVSTQSVTILGDSLGNVFGGSMASDVLQGRGGNDVMYGNDGSDTYLFARGDGADYLDDYDYDGVADQDVVSFFSGVARDQLWFTQSGTNLNVAVIGTNDMVTIGNYYHADTGHKVEKIWAGNQELTGTGIANMVSAMASLTPPPFGQTNLSTAQHSQLDSVIAANWHSA